MSFKRQWELKDIHQYKLQRPSGVGLELEWEFNDSTRAHQVFRGLLPNSRTWAATEDGSLRDGIEFKSYVCADARTSLKMLAPFVDLCVNEENITVGHRCSVHVHLNYQHNTVDDVLCFLALYTALEPWLNKLSGDRSDNPYCIGVQEGYGHFKHVVEVLKECKEDANLQSIVNQAVSRNWKYSCLNILPLAGFGTVEIRTMEGTYDLDRIADWAELLGRMKQLATDKDIDDFIDYLNKTSINQLAEILGMHVQYSHTMGDDYRKSVYRSMCLFTDASKTTKQFKALTYKVANIKPPNTRTGRRPQTRIPEEVYAHIPRIILPRRQDTPGWMEVIMSREHDQDWNNYPDYVKDLVRDHWPVKLPLTWRTMTNEAIEAKMRQRFAHIMSGRMQIDLSNCYAVE